MKKILICGVMVAALAGCETLQGGVEKGREFSAARVGNILIGECKLSAETRGKNLRAVNNYLITQGVTPRATAQDCDGDGTPDRL
jgi:hypothetical protein